MWTKVSGRTDEWAPSDDPNHFLAVDLNDTDPCCVQWEVWEGWLHSGGCYQTLSLHGDHEEALGAATAEVARRNQEGAV